ncbi:adenylate kinase family protein [Candidatus Woesearchaeota archaeon]|nr:adenylate kinase family protein [Candidatus Woesearchaeota archaeon]
MIIVISGSPCTGKTTLAKALAERLGYIYFDVNEFVKTHLLSDGYDPERDCEIVDSKKLNRALLKELSGKNDMIIDSHLAHFLPAASVDLCIITRCDIKELNKRLKKRGYKEKKIRENLDVEIFDSCFTEAKEQGHNILEIDTTKSYNINDIAKKVLKK